MDPSTSCDLKGETAFIKMLEHELKGTKSSSLTRSRSSKGGKKSRKNLKMTGGMNKEHVKFAIKAFIYLIFGLISFGGCVEIYANRDFLTKIANILGISVEVFILIISAVVTGVKTDYRNDSLTKIPFDYIRGVMAGHHIVGKQIIDVVLFFVRSKNQLNIYLEERIEDALKENDANAITNDAVVDQSSAVTAVRNGMTNIMSFVHDFRGQSERASESNVMVLHNSINSELATPRDTDSSRRRSIRGNARQLQILDDDLDRYMGRDSMGRK
jgi:hypothetical protein